MAGLGLDVRVKLDELLKLKNEIAATKSELKGMNRRGNEQAYDSLNAKLKTLSDSHRKLAAETDISIRQIQKLGQETQQTSTGMSVLGNTLLKIGGTTALIGLAKQVVEVRNQFQQLEIAFTTMLQSEEKATELMRDLARFAAETPFGLESSASGARQLIAYGSAVENVIDELRMLGDVAAGTGQSINDLVYLYGTLRVQGRAYLMDIRQFAGRGIPIYDELAKVLGTTKNEVSSLVSAGKVGFEEVETAFKNMTAQGSMFGGLMEKQSKSIGGRIEELKDNIDALFNTIGQNSEGIIYNSINTVNLLVANYEKVGKLILGLVATYGIYRTALIVNTIATQTFAATQLQLGVVLARIQKTWRALNATMAANPYVLLVTVISGLITTMWALNDATSIQEKAQERLNKLNEDASQIKQNLQGETQQLISVINSETASILQQIVAFNNLQSKYPVWLNNMSLAEFQAISLKEQQILLNKALEEFEDVNLDNLISSQKKIIENLKAEERTIRDNSAAKNLNEQLKIQEEILTNLQRQKEARQEAQKLADFQSKPEEERRQILQEQLEDLQKQRQSIEDQIGEIRSVKDAWNEFHPMFNEFISQLEDIEQKTKDIKNQLEGKTTLQNKSFWEKQKKEAETALESMTAADKGSKEWNKQLKLLNEAQSKLKIWDFSDRSRNKTEQTYQKQIEARQWLINRQAELDNEAIQNELEAEQRMLDLKQDSFDKQFHQNELNFRKELVQIANYENELSKKQQEAAKHLFVQKNGTDTGFNFAAFNLSTLPEGLRPEDIEQQIENRNQIALKGWIKGNEDIRKEQDRFFKEALQDYETFEEKRNSIALKYIDLRGKAIESGNIHLLENLYKAEREELSKLNLSELQEQINWEQVFGNLDKVSTSALGKVRKQLQEYVSSMANTLATNDLKAITEAIDSIDIKMIDRQPVDELTSGYAEYRKAIEAVNKAKAEQAKYEENTPEYAKATKDLAEAENDRNKSLLKISKSVNNIGSKGSQVVNSGLEVIDMLENMGVSIDDTTKKAIEGVGQIMSGLERINLAQPFTAVTGSISVLSGIGNTIAGLFGGGKRTVSETTLHQYESLMNTLDDLINKQKDYITSFAGREALTAYRTSLDLIEKQIEATRRLGREFNDSYRGSNTFGWHDRKNIEQYRDQIESIGISWNKLTLGGSRLSGIYSLSADELRLLKEQVPEAWAKLNEQTREYLQTIIDSGEELETLKDQLNEALTGMTFDAARDSLKSLIMDADASFEDIADNFEGYMRNAIANIALSGVDDSLKKWYEEFARAMDDGILSEDEKRNLQELYQSIFDSAKSDYNNALEAAGVKPETSTTNQSPSRGVFEGMSQDTANALEGRFSDLQMSNREILTETFTISDTVKQHLIHLQNIENVQVQALFELRDINRNTNELFDINSGIQILNRGINK